MGGPGSGRRPMGAKRTLGNKNKSKNYIPKMSAENKARIKAGLNPLREPGTLRRISVRRSK